MRWWKTVIHVHTNYSPDANASCAAMIETARRQRVDCVAITDHDQVAGAVEASEIGGVKVIIGEEITTADGHLIGLFLRERIPPRLSAEETARRIRAQGGLVLAPHPRAMLCDGSLTAQALEQLMPWLDGIEVWNAQNPLLWESWWAWAFARRHGIASYAGADSHARGYLAACYQMMPAFDGPAEFLRSLGRARLRLSCFGPDYFAAMGLRYVWGAVLPKWPGRQMDRRRRRPGRARERLAAASADDSRWTKTGRWRTITPR